MAYLHNAYIVYVHKVRVDEQNTLLLYYCITVTVLLYGCITVLLYYALEFDVRAITHLKLTCKGHYALEFDV